MENLFVFIVLHPDGQQGHCDHHGGVEESTRETPCIIMRQNAWFQTQTSLDMLILLEVQSCQKRSNEKVEAHRAGPTNSIPGFHWAGTL